jgi:hypothetical protein
MNKTRRKDDSRIEEIRQDVKDILKVLNPHNGNVGVVAQVSINKDNIAQLKTRPSNIKNWMIAAAVIANTVIAGIALYNAL